MGWQIDPFGHSRENARLFDWLGFDGLFFARNDFRDKDQRMINKTLDMIWKTGETLPGLESELYTEVQIHHYEAPPGYCYDTLCQDEPIMDDPNLHDFNAVRLIDDFLKIVKQDFELFKEGPAKKHLIYAMGSDFQYQNANMNYKNLDKLIKYVNERTSSTGIEALYSTPSCYLKGLYEDYINLYPDYQWSEKTDDFFPYASGDHSYWTGFFISRPTLKYFERKSNNFLQASKQVFALLGDQSNGKAELYSLQRAMATMQHHDAVTGTEKQHVADDYAKLLHEGLTATQSVIGPLLFNKAGLNTFDRVDFTCPLVNISACHLTEPDQPVVMLIYNPLTRPLTKMVQIPSGEADKAVYDQFKQIEAEFVPIDGAVLRIPGRDSQAKYNMYFLAEDLPPLGYKTFYIQNGVQVKSKQILKGKKVAGMDGKIASVAYYKADSSPDQPSGAYIFRPSGDKHMLEATLNESFEGQLINEQRFTTNQPWATFTQRKFSHENHFEVEWLVGPLPFSGTEVVMVYHPQTETSDAEEFKQEFWTDSNGRQMVYRVQDTRFSYDLHDGATQEPVTSNYYPINAAMVSKTNSTNEIWSILTDRSQGGTKLKGDEMEIMVHRRLFHDDHFGVGEALDEHAFGQALVVIGKHLVLKGQEDDPRWRRLKAQELYMGGQEFFLPTDLLLQEWRDIPGEKEYSFLTYEDVLPENVHLMSLENWDSPDSSNGLDVLLRFENLYEANEMEFQTSEIEIPEDFFKGFLITSVEELALGGDRPIEDVKNKMKWTANQSIHQMFEPLKMGLSSFSFKLDPMAIRTFKATLSLQ